MLIKACLQWHKCNMQKHELDVRSFFNRKSHFLLEEISLFGFAFFVGTNLFGIIRCEHEFQLTKCQKQQINCLSLIIKWKFECMATIWKRKQCEHTAKADVYKLWIIVVNYSMWRCFQILLLAARDSLWYDNVYVEHRIRKSPSSVRAQDKTVECQK